MGLMKIRDSARVCETLRIAFGISCSVETGTFHGRTASWAEERSERVITVELLEPLYRAAAIFQHNGDPRRELARLSSSLPPAIVWLDTDCCAGPSGGMGDECPFLGEIAVLAPAWERLYVLVDDARYFIPPPPQHDAPQWPSLAQVVSPLNTGEDRFVALFVHVLVSLPPAARDATLGYIRKDERLNMRVLGYKRPEAPALL